MSTYRSTAIVIIMALVTGYALGVAVGGDGFISTAYADRQPHMLAALDSLREARGHLNQATDDKGGHRAKALNRTNEAINQVEKGIAFDNRN